MYLEISPRQTGKSTRLLHAVRTSLEDRKDAIIVAHNYEASEMLRKKFFATYPDSLNFAKRVQFKCVQTNLKTILTGYRTDSLNLFFDEFDFFNTPNTFWNAGFDFKGSIPSLRNGYFCTTPKFTRELSAVVNPYTEDFFCMALQANAYKYVVVNPTMPNSTRQELISTLSRDQLITEILGKFI